MPSASQPVWQVLRMQLCNCQDPSLACHTPKSTGCMCGVLKDALPNGPRLKSGIPMNEAHPPASPPTMVGVGGLVVKPPAEEERGNVMPLTLSTLNQPRTKLRIDPLRSNLSEASHVRVSGLAVGALVVRSISSHSGPRAARRARSRDARARAGTPPFVRCTPMVSTCPTD